MAGTVIEQLASRNVLIDGGKRYGTTEWYVTGESNQTRALTYSGIPSFGKAHPDDFSLRAKRFDTSRAPGTSDIIVVTVRYEQSQFNELEEEEPQDPDVAGYLMPGVTFETAFENVWRTDLSPITGEVSNDNTTDIGGIKADINGEPIPVVRRRGVLTIRQTVAGVPNVSVILENAGKRNVNTFLGAESGKLVYKPQNSVPNDDLNTSVITHNFVYDPWFHLVQVPKRLNGKIISDGGDPWRAETVFWRQPFPETFDVSLLGQLEN